MNQFAAMTRPRVRARLLADHVIEDVARRFGVDEDKVRAHGRPYPVIRARHWAWWLLVRRYGLSQMGVGRMLGWDASTVWHAVHKMDREVRRGRIPAEIADLVEEVAA